MLTIKATIYYTDVCIFQMSTLPNNNLQGYYFNIRVLANLKTIEKVCQCLEKDLNS